MVLTMTAVRIARVRLGAQTRMPYRMVRLIQMKWKGIVELVGNAYIAATFATAKSAQMISGRYLAHTEL